MKTYLVILFILFYSITDAQIILIPDSNFKSKLLSASTTNVVAFGSDLQTSIIIDANSNGEIEVSEALQVYGLDVNSSNISSMQGLESFTNLTQLMCFTNQLTTLDVSENVNLIYINCSNNLLSTLDTSSIFDLSMGVNCDNNQLTFLNLKGIGESWMYTFNGLIYDNNPDLEYICIREVTSDPTSLYAYIQESNELYGYTNCEVNSYCSFTPGGIFYTIQGGIRYDSDGDGCDSSDPHYPNMNFNLTDGTVVGNSIANDTGNYSLPVEAGTHIITPVLENPEYFIVAPSSGTVTFPAASSPFTQDFCITANGIHNDLEILIVPFDATVGYDAHYKIKYRNKGTNAQSGVINLAFDDAVLDFVSAIPAISDQAPNSIGWDFSNLQPFESREIDYVFNINSSTDTPPVNENDILHYSATVTAAVDETPMDNSITLSQYVWSSFDPNDKTCLEGPTIAPNMAGEYVHYKIGFENTGTANAQNIVIKDVIDTSNYLTNSLVPMAGSAPFVTRITDTNNVEFIFENINLPFDDANNDGYVAFKIKIQPSLVIGDTFSNMANIYFDYNAPIATNSANTTIAALSTQDLGLDNYFTIFPVPARETINIKIQRDISINSLSIYNPLGQLILTIINPGDMIDLSSLKSGHHFLKFFTEKGIITKKFYKE